MWPPLSTKLFEVLKIAPAKQRLALYVPDWQRRRMDMKGQWADKTELPRILESLEDYTEGGRIVDLEFRQDDIPIGEYITRMWRVVNLLDAVYMGWKDKHIKTPEQDAFCLFKQIMATKYHREHDVLRHEQKELGRAWQWKAVTDQVEVLRLWREVSPSDQKRIILDLANRFSNTVRKAKERYKLQDPVKIAIQDRPELFWFLELVAPGRALTFAASTLREIDTATATVAQV